MGTALWWREYTRSVLSFTSPISVPNPTPNPITTPAQGWSASGGKPTHIRIPSVGIDLPITEATVADNIWEVTTTSANHWDTSGSPGDKNNIVIYAHNWKSLFGPLLTVSEDEQIELTDATGNTFTYTVVQTVNIKPNQVEYIEPAEEETLTLYTCSGFLDSQRFIVIAKPVES